MMSTTMRSVAIQREVELLWQAAESERSKAQRLQLELTDTTAALHEALADLREASEEVANLKGQLRAVSDRAEDTADHYRHLLFDAQSKATLEERRLQSEHAARLLAVEEREARTAAHEATFRECLAFAQQQLGVEAPNVFASSCRHFIDEFSSDVRRWVRGLQAQSTTDIVDRCASFGDGVNKLWRDGMIEHTMELKSMLTNVDQLTISVAAPSPASLDANVAPTGVQRPVTHDANRGSQRHIAGSSLLEQQFNNFMLASHELRFQHTTLASDLLADSTTFVFARALHSAQIDMMKLAATSASSRSISAEDEDAMRARMEELQEAAAASERRLVSRDGLIQTLKRRATASEDQVTQLQEELRTAEQTNKERERQLQSAASRLHDQQQLSLDLRNALTLRDEELAKVREAGYLPSSSGASHATGSGPMTDLTPESVGRQGATTFLREQLSQQMDLLHRIEESEQRAANERATILVANTMGQLFAAMGHDMLQDRAEYLEWISGRMQEERLFLRERLVEAAEQLAEMDRHRQRLEELIAGTYKSSALAGDGALQQPFHLSSLYDVVEVAMTAPTSSHVFSSASMFGNQRGAERLFVGFDHQLEQHAQHLAAALGALFLEVKLEFNQLQLQAHRSLLRMFWALAPKERASSHVRVHILEGALAVSEAQRIQSVTVAQWLEEQCLAARDSLSNLLRDTREALAGWEDRGGGRYYDSATPPPILAGGGNATLRIGAGGLQSLLVSPAGSPRHGHDGFDASFTLNNTKRSVRTLHGGVLPEDDLLQLQENMAVADRRAARDAVVAHQTCDRLLETFTSLQNRLLEAEVAAQHAIGHTTEQNIEAEELRLQLDRQVLTHALEQEIADDAVAMLREMLRVERREAQSLIQLLLNACLQRDTAILHLHERSNQLRKVMRLLLLAARYVSAAYESTLELNMDDMIQCAQWVRAATIPTPKEVAFALTTVHWEFGKALESAAADVRASFGDVAGWLKAVNDENFYLRKDLATAAATLNRVAQERAAERVAMDAFQAFVYHGVEDAFTTQGRALWEHVLSLREIAWSALKQHAQSHEKVAELETVATKLRTMLRESEVSLDEHRVALASASEAVTSIDKVLGERLAALRDRELEIHNLRTRQLEHESLIASLRSHIVTYHEMLVSAGADKEASAASYSEQCAVLLANEKSLVELRGELDVVTAQLEEERGAHRHTIRTIADSLTPAV